MIVMKFGGTSVGDAERFSATADTIRRFFDERPLVIASAVGGITNLLDKAADEAVLGHSLLDEILLPHRRIIRDLNLEPQDFFGLFEQLRATLESIALQKRLSPQYRDKVHSFGERFSVEILARLLQKRGINAVAWEAGKAGMVTDSNHGSALPLPKSRRLISEWYKAIGNVIPIVTGYIGRTEDGEITTLGRGGSDLSAAWFAAALETRELQIWTDVTGVMSADPRLVPDACSIECLSFDEASEMAFRGAKVLHKDTLRPVRESGIPVRVLNSFEPDGNGTLIVEHGISRGVKCCTTRHDLLVWSFIEEYGIPRNKFLHEALGIFNEFLLPIELIASSESGFAVVTPYLPEYSTALARLAAFCRVSVSRGNALVSLVGDGCCESDNLGIACNALKSANVAWKLVVSSPTGRSFSFILREGDLSIGVRMLHTEFALARPQACN